MLDKFISNKYVHVVLFSIFLDRSTISLFRKQKVEKSGKYEYEIKLLQEENLSVKHHSYCSMCALQVTIILLNRRTNILRFCCLHQTAGFSIRIYYIQLPSHILL